MRSSPPVFLVVQYMSANGMEQGYNKIRWHPIEMKDLTHFKEAMISYGNHLPYVKQIPNYGDTQNRIIPKDWKGLMTGILDWSTITMINVVEGRNHKY